MYIQRWKKDINVVFIIVNEEILLTDIINLNSFIFIKEFLFISLYNNFN